MISCTACGSKNVKAVSDPVPVSDMPPGVLVAPINCIECGVTLPMALTQKEALELEMGVATGDTLSAESNTSIVSEPKLYQLNLSLSGLPQRFNESPGSSWHSRYRESQRWHKRVLGRMMLERLSPPPLPLKKASLILVRHSSRCPDYDGLVHSFKPVIDALKKCLVIADDRMSVIGKPNYLWEQAKQRAGKIEITVQEVA